MPWEQTMRRFIELPSSFWTVEPSPFLQRPTRRRKPVQTIGVAEHHREKRGRRGGEKSWTHLAA